MTKTSKLKQQQKEKMWKLNRKSMRGSILGEKKGQRPHVIRRFIALKKEIKEIKSNEYYYEIINEHMLKVLIANLINNEIPLMECNHVLINANLIALLLECQMVPSISHMYYHPSSDENLQQLLRDDLLRKLKIEQMPLKRKTPSELPFLYAEPDIVLEDRIIIAQHFNGDKLTREMCLYALVAMEIFDKEIAEIYIYDAHFYYPWGEGLDLQLCKKVAIKKKGKVFTKSLIKLACKGYTSYLRIFFALMNNQVHEKELLAIYYFLVDNALKVVKDTWTSKNFLNTNLCTKVRKFSDVSFHYVHDEDNNYQFKTESRAETMYSAAQSKLNYFINDVQNVCIKNSITDYTKSDFSEKMFSKYAFDKNQLCMTKEEWASSTNWENIDYRQWDKNRARVTIYRTYVIEMGIKFGRKQIEKLICFDDKNLTFGREINYTSVIKSKR